MYRIVKPKFTKRDHESAELKLAFLKENPVFLRFFSYLMKRPYLLCPQFRKPEEISQEYRKRILLRTQKSSFFLEEPLRHFGINYDFVSSIQINESIPTQDILGLLHPLKEIDEISNSKLISLLPMLFYSQGVYGFRRSLGSFDKSSLKLHERLIKIDLSKRKTQLIEDFKQYLDHEFSLYDVGSKIGFRAFDWSVESDRNRKEAWKQLEVWKLRKLQGGRKRRTFKEISLIQGETEDTIKKRYYKAYERIYGQPYNPDHFKKTAKVKKNELLKTCKTCTDKQCLKKLKTPKEWIPCPEILPFIEQDQVKFKNIDLKEDPYSYR